MSMKHPGTTGTITMWTLTGVKDPFVIYLGWTRMQQAGTMRVAASADALTHAAIMYSCAIAERMGPIRIVVDDLQGNAWEWRATGMRELIAGMAGLVP